MNLLSICSTRNTPSGYLLVSALAFMIAVVAISSWGLVDRDHFAAISSGHGPTWYQDLGGDAVTEIQDQDIFFHNIGDSVQSLRQADIVIVGSSLVTFAVDGAKAQRELQEKFGLKFYNMSFLGISSGEFTRLILEKYQVYPKLLIINADDGGGGGNFFGKGIQRSFSGDVKTIAATKHNRLLAFKEVVRRNLRWRMEALSKTLFHFGILEREDRVPIPRFYRDAATGNADMSEFPRYGRTDNMPVSIKRDPDCHTNADAVRLAREFVKSTTGELVLTVIPNTHYCEQQAREIADQLGIELVLPGTLAYSSWDGGGHFDRRGSLAFTGDLLVALEKTQAFQRIKNSAQTK